MGKLKLGVLSGLIAFATTAAAAAAECTPIDLRGQLNTPIRDQGNVSWCYAYSTADYLQFYFKLQNIASAADLAVQYNLHFWPKLLRWLSGGVVPQTGFVKTVLRDALASGYCPEEYFPSTEWTKRFLAGEKAGKSESVLLKDAAQDLMELGRQIQMGWYESANELPFVYEFKEVSKEQLFDVLSEAKPQAVLNRLRVLACEKHRVAYPLEVPTIKMRIKGARVFDQINELLESQIPVNVDYFSGYLENAERYSHGLQHLHSTLLLGRQFDPETNECTYLIRNSHGTDCRNADPRHHCHGGYLWVGESTFYRALITYVYLDRTKNETIEPETGDQDSQSSAFSPDESGDDSQD